MKLRHIQRRRTLAPHMQHRKKGSSAILKHAIEIRSAGEHKPLRAAKHIFFECQQVLLHRDQTGVVEHMTAHFHRAHILLPTKDILKMINTLVQTRLGHRG